MDTKKKFTIATLGCRTNQYESQGYSDQLRQVGFSEAKKGEKADLCIINTCTVTHGADSASRREIRSLARKHKGAKIVITGCMVESNPQSIKEIDPEALIIPNQKKEKLLPIIFPEIESFPEFSIRQFEAHTRAFVKVQDGCNSFCTYCIIPYVRGRSRSRKTSEILSEIKKLIENGYKEVVLTGINIGDFVDGKENLASLIRKVDKLDGLERIRVSSIDPDEVDDDLADAILSGEKTCPSMHIVLQSGSNVVLKRMNRKYTRQMFEETVEKLKKVNPHFTFTTDIIVGFPGETKTDFEETIHMVQNVKFAKVHVFPYSVRARTRAALYPDQVPTPLIQERKQLLLREAEKASFSLRENYIGKTLKVLLEEKEEKALFGHSENFLRVKVLEKNLRSNQIISTTITKNTPEGLVGNVHSH